MSIHRIAQPFARCVSRGAALIVLGTTTFLNAADPPKTPPTPAGPVNFLRDVRPILAGHCFKCHGPDEEARKAKLRLDVREDALKPAKSGELAIVPRHPDKSELVHRVFATDEDELMPPPGAKRPLTDEQKEILKRWIADGAEYQPHWAFIKPVAKPPPTVKEKNWPKNPIDRFVLARLESQGLKPSDHADKFTLVRRLYLDLIGLPPTPAEADAFVNDSSPQAYEKLVDRLLASPHYGERWARRWLDLARYADTNGFEKDRPRTIWPWRDWVINALNADLPFDRFTIEQLAGDMLPNATADQLIATGLHRNTMLNEEGGIDPLEYRFYSTVDRVHVTATAWLGLTVACAQCHTHKFDPIQHTDYYRFMACLNNADEPIIDIPKPEIVAQRQQLQEKIEALEAGLADKFPESTRIEWLTPGAAEFASKNGAEGQLLNDGSFRVSGPRPAADVYTVQFDVAAPRITHIQIEAIPDEQVGRGGPGRTDHGNFVLSEVELELRGKGKAKTQKLKFSHAEADFSQASYPAAHAIDGKADTGWAIAAEDGKRMHRHLILTLAKPLELKKQEHLTLRLSQNFGTYHTLGRFRVSLGNELPEPGTSVERRREVRDRKFAAWIANETQKAVTWKILRPTEARTTMPFLTLQPDDSILAGGDFTKSDTYTLKFQNLPPGVKAVRLEVLPDDRLPMHGPGSVAYEGPRGDFWLSNLRATAGGKPVTLRNATESFANGGNDAAKAIDSDLQSGWSIDGGQGRAHNAVFQFTDALPGGDLELNLTCERYYAAGLGRFRLAFTTADDAKAAALPDAVAAVLLKYREPEKQKTLLTSAKAEADRALLMRQFVKVAPDLAIERGEIDRLRAQLPSLPTTLAMRERSADHLRPTFRHHRGEFLQPKEAVTAGVPAFLPQLPEDAPKDRLALAKWLVSRDNPLTARVVMNRQWEAFFGRGIVRTLEDFGFQGELPSHPDLLDWLALEFQRQKWSQKQMHKLMVMSATYQQSSRVTPEWRERDPLNILLARGPRFRMEAEMVRDSALVASGLFSDKLGGPSVYPPQPPGVSTEGAYGALAWKASEGPDRYRRGLYTFAKRTTPYAMTATFDGPSGEACLARRDRSNTPLQALTLLNDTVFMECARALGAAAGKLEGSDEARVEMIFRRCLTRPPSADERKKLLQFYQQQLARFAAGELKAAEVLDAKTGERLNEQAAWTTLARVLLNLDEAIAKS